ncbi:MAG: hypothetical protein JNL32_01945 [Candidatus Kapabacteria bacterium]|nr:hypothetical protein [Candidatus Kapabacteria bacterium]
MNGVLTFLYKYILSYILVLIEVVLAWLNPKIQERRRGLRYQRQSRSSTLSATSKVAWFHAASMGEFEQLKPVIELLAEQRPDIQRVVTFSSPSGYKNSQTYPYADRILYREDDIPNRMAKQFADIQPSIVIINRYDVWHSMMQCCLDTNVPVVIVNATYPSATLFKSRIGKAIVSWLYSSFDTVIPIREEERCLFASILPPKNVHTALPDTRYDRILHIVHEQKLKQTFQWIRDQSTKPILVCGSTWNHDELMIASLPEELSSRWRIVIVPHEPTEQHIAHLLEMFTDALLLSESTPSTQTSNKPVIVDSVGKLLALYSIADAAYIGGGFGAGVHSVTEAAAYGIPVACGTAIERNLDARQMADKGILRVCTTAHGFNSWLHSLLLEQEIMKSPEAAEYVYNQSGSSTRILEVILRILG